jgi:hypothetical protein
MVTLSSGKFTDAGYRYRLNTFIRTDKWWVSKEIEQPYYDYVFYNSDTFEVSKNETAIAEMYFRIDVDQMVHHRQVFSLMDFFGSVGGINQILTEVAVLIYGSFASYYFYLSTIEVMFKDVNIDFSNKILLFLRCN